MRHIIFSYILILLLSVGCTNKEQSSGDKATATLINKDADIKSLIADTIIYPVTIFNFDSTDTWSEYRLKNVQREKLVKDIFDAIYSGNLTVYHYYTDKPLSIDDIKELESTPDFARERIEEIQFVETWHFSPELKQFQKEVHSIVIAYALYNENGERGGLKAAFKIKLLN